MPAASRRNRLSETVVYVLNPLPTIHESEVLKKAGLDLLEPSKVPPFRLVYQYSSGFEGERVVLEPGESVPMRKSEADECLKHLHQLGAVAVVDPDDEEEVRAASIRGIRTAIRFWEERGRARINWYRRERGITEKEVEDMRHQLHPWYTAQAKSDILKETLRQYTTRSKTRS